MKEMRDKDYIASVLNGGELDYKKLAKNIKIQRMRCFLKKRQVSKITGLFPDTISDIERGIKKPQLRNIRKIASAINIDAEELIRKSKKITRKRKNAE